VLAGLAAIIIVSCAPKSNHVTPTSLQITSNGKFEVKYRQNGTEKTSTIRGTGTED
jgi:hypothetical protein